MDAEKDSQARIGLLEKKEMLDGPGIDILNSFMLLLGLAAVGIPIASTSLLLNDVLTDMKTYEGYGNALGVAAVVLAAVYFLIDNIVRQPYIVRSQNAAIATLKLQLDVMHKDLNELRAVSTVSQDPTKAVEMANAKKGKLDLIFNSKMQTAGTGGRMLI
jgi:hypothetical protein